MSDVSPTGEQLLEQAGPVLRDTQALIDKALSALKARTVVEGKLSNARLDEYQLVSYELSLCWAECCAARFMLDHAVECQDEFTSRLCALFCAEAVTATGARLRARSADFELADGDIAAVLDGEVARHFLPAQLAAANIAAIGQEVMERGADLGPDALEERYTMMRDSFHRFADEVVMPLAESVHSEDLIIPDEILKPLKEMGVFGLSIPESYGGLQEDDKEDTLGMIVVTEELSRGSLGAAGSLITRPEILARALLKGGTEEQKQHWLPQAGRGRAPVRGGGDRTQLRLRCRRRKAQSHPDRGRLAAQRRQDLVHLWRQGRCADGAGPHRPRPRPGPQRPVHVPGGKAQQRRPRFRSTAKRKAARSPVAPSPPSATAACTPTSCSSTTSSCPLTT